MIEGRGVGRATTRQAYVECIKFWWMFCLRQLYTVARAAATTSVAMLTRGCMPHNKLLLILLCLWPFWLYYICCGCVHEHGHVLLVTACESSPSASASVAAWCLGCSTHVACPRGASSSSHKLPYSNWMWIILSIEHLLLKAPGHRQTVRETDIGQGHVACYSELWQ